MPAMPMAIRTFRLEPPPDDGFGTFTLAFFLGPSERGVGGIREMVAGGRDAAAGGGRNPGDRLKPVTLPSHRRRPGAGLLWNVLVTILALLIGLAVGAAGVYLVALRRALADRDAAVADAREAERALAESEGALAAERRAFDDRLQATIKGLTTDALQANANAFTEQAMGRLGVVMEPLQKSLDKVEVNVQLLEQQRQRAYGEIHKELEIVRLNNEGLSRQTGNLVSALRGNSQVRGQWGEIQLRRVIEMAGMLSYCDFDEQHTLTGDDGAGCAPT